MKWFLASTILGVLLICGCIFSGKGRGGAGSPGGGSTGKAVSAPAAQKAATNGNPQAVSTNLSSERAANQAITKAATNSQSVGGAINAPGGVSFGGGVGTGEHGGIFWFYVALGVGFLVWLVLAIWHRVHVRHRTYAHEPPNAES